MKVGEERADDAEVEAGRDEDIGGAGMRLDWVVPGGERGGFEGADNGSADCDDAAVLGRVRLMASAAEAVMV